MTRSTASLALPLRSALVVCSALAFVGSGCSLTPVHEDPDGDTGEHDSGGAADDSSFDEESTDEGMPVTCPAGHGPTMHDGSGLADEVWAAEDSPHVIPYDITVHNGITIEPCSVVQLGGGIMVTIAEGGSIHADGAADEGEIRFERLVADDAWVSIRVMGGTMALAHTTLAGGGDPLNGASHIAAAVLVRGRAGASSPDGTLSVQDVVIEGSLSQGVRIEDNGAFTDDSDDLVVVDSVGSPITTAFDGAGSIPAGAYTGNGDDRIILTDAINDSVSHDMTLHDRGVPYLVGAPGQLADLRVDGGTGGFAILTIEPGVEMQFRPGAIMRIDPDSAEEPATAALVAVGTADDPIVFTSAEPSPAAGDWLGLTFGSDIADDTQMQHVRVEFAGGESTSGSNSCPYGGGDGINEAAIRLLGVPPGAFITDTEIVASMNHGIDRGWRDDLVVDFSTGNTFDVGGCRQTVSRTDDGVCPDPVPCE